jgi:hypothetical protein
MIHRGRVGDEGDDPAGVVPKRIELAAQLFEIQLIIFRAKNLYQQIYQQFFALGRLRVLDKSITAYPPGADNHKQPRPPSKALKCEPGRKSKTMCTSVGWIWKWPHLSGRF